MSEKNAFGRRVGVKKDLNCNRILGGKRILIWQIIGSKNNIKSLLDFLQ